MNDALLRRYLHGNGPNLSFDRKYQVIHTRNATHTFAHGRGPRRRKVERLPFFAPSTGHPEFLLIRERPLNLEQGLFPASGAINPASSGQD